MLKRDVTTKSVCLKVGSSTRKKKSPKYDVQTNRRSLVPIFQIALATLKKAVAEATEPKGRTFCLKILGQYTTK